MSRYENYAIKNNVFGTLAVPISSLSTSIQLNNGEWARFSVNQLATLENTEDWKVKKREIVLITAIVWDVLTVTRKYEPCPSSDDANTQWQVSFAFWVDDTISAYITKEHFDKIDDSINDIYENWLDKLRTDVVSWLQVKISGWPILIWSSYYDFAWWTLTLTNNATNYIEIDEDWNLVVNTTDWTLENAKISKVTTSWWAVTNIEDWRLWTVWGKIGWVDIHELTEKTYINKDDEFLITDSENIYQNKKIKAENILLNLWDWSDWNCVISSDTIMEAKKYNFENFTVCSWVKLCFCWDAIPVIKVRCLFDNQWEIYLQNIHLTEKIANIISPIWIVKTVANIKWLSEIVEEIWWDWWYRGRRLGAWWVVCWYCWANWGDWWWIWESWCNWCDDWTRTWWAGWTWTEFAWGGWWWWAWWCWSVVWCNWWNASWCTWWKWGDWWTCWWWWGGWWFWLCQWGDWWNWWAGNVSWSWGNWWNSCCLWWNWWNWWGGSTSYAQLTDWWRWWDWYCCWWNWWAGGAFWNWWDWGNWIMVKWWNWWCASTTCWWRGWNWWYSVYWCWWNWWAWWCGSSRQRWDWGNWWYWYIRWGNWWKGGDCSGDYPWWDWWRWGDSYLQWWTWWEWGCWLSAARHNWWDWWDSRMWMYTLVVFGDCICAWIICWPWWNWGNWWKWWNNNCCTYSWWNWWNWWRGWDWWNAYLVYRTCGIEWCYYVKWWKGGCWWRWWTTCLGPISNVADAINCVWRNWKDWTDWKDWEVILINCFII